MKNNNIDATASIKSLNKTHAKCPRCKHHHLGWGAFGHLKYEIDLNPKLIFERLCQRCIDVILLEHPNHESVQYIKLYEEKEKEYYNINGTWIDSMDKITIWV